MHLQCLQYNSKQIENSMWSKAVEYRAESKGSYSPCDLRLVCLTVSIQYQTEELVKQRWEQTGGSQSPEQAKSRNTNYKNCSLSCDVWVWLQVMVSWVLSRADQRFKHVWQASLCTPLIKALFLLVSNVWELAKFDSICTFPVLDSNEGEKGATPGVAPRDRQTVWWRDF